MSLCYWVAEDEQREIVGVRLSREIKLAPCLVKMLSFGGETDVTSLGRWPVQFYTKAVHYLGYIPHTLSDAPTKFKEM